MAQPILTLLSPAHRVPGQGRTVGVPLCTRGCGTQVPEMHRNTFAPEPPPWAESSTEQAWAGASHGTRVGDAAPGDLTQGFTLVLPAGKACAQVSTVSFVSAFTQSKFKRENKRQRGSGATRSSPKEPRKRRWCFEPQHHPHTYPSARLNWRLKGARGAARERARRLITPLPPPASPVWLRERGARLPAGIQQLTQTLQEMEHIRLRLTPNNQMGWLFAALASI